MAKPLLYTTRNEVDAPLDIIEGTLPADVQGAFYVSYPVGSVNSGGLPFPETYPDGKHCQEFGSAIMNGDGMGLRVIFTPGQTPTVRTRILKTPCYYADYATRHGNPGSELLGFKNLGISRLSLALGARNEVNTAYIPVKFGSSNPFLLATYDVGRPFALDPGSMTLQTPIGWNREWTPCTPAYVPWPFSLAQTTAHPSFDPVTQELFTTNFLRPGTSMLFEQRMFHFMKHEPELLEKEMEELAHEVEGQQIQSANDRITQFLNNLHTELDRPDPATPEMLAAADTPGAVWLMRWKGAAGDMERWTLHDPKGNPVVIEECMHQTGLTEDFIVLTDCSFKFSIDLLVSNPFPHNQDIDRMIRRFLSRPMVPQTNVYVVRRKDLTPGGGKAVAYPLDKPIPVETIHFSCNYANPGGKVTLFGVHNAATCVAEWVRPYDVDKLTGQETDRELLSLFSIGSMDVSRFGKWVFDAENARLLPDESAQFAEVGNWESDNPGPNAWAVALYAYRDMISADKPVNEIRRLWFIADGVDNRMLTDFIYNLYTDYPNRIVPLETLLEVTKKGIPFSLCRLDTDTMKSGDYYQAPQNTYLRCVHFIPRPTPTPNIDPQLDGYLMVLAQAGYPESNDTWRYQSEYWLFDATNIAQGPICKMYSPKVENAFVLHTAFLPEVLPYNNPYQVNIRQDYNESIQQLPIKGLFGFVDKAALTLFFDKFVYPNYPQFPPEHSKGQFWKSIWEGIVGVFKKRKKR
ncbi:MAG: carotenoid oxygenase family protein [Saprospiraceae bacterium]